MKIVLNAAYLQEKEQAHDYLAQMLDLPDYYGKNLDALHDCLTELPETRVLFVNIPAQESYYSAVRAVFADSAEENEHLQLNEAMLALGTRPLETERLLLRPVTLADAPQLHENLLSDSRAAEHMLWEPHKNLAETEAFVQRKLERYSDGLYFDWGVELKQTGELIGAVSADVTLPHRIAELEQCFGSQWWGQGYAAEAVKAILDYMLKEVKVDKVMGRYLSSNPASGRVMKKAGMHCDGSLPGYAADKTTGERVDMVYYSMDRRLRW